MYPFDRFSDHAKQVLSMAQEEAQQARHAYIGTEHLLLALLREQDGLAARVLAGFGVEIGAVREALGGGEPGPQRLTVPTARVKRVIELAFEEARRMRQSRVGTEHILFGLLTDGDDLAVKVLRDMGVTLEAARAEVARLGEHGEGGPIYQSQRLTDDAQKVVALAQEEAELARHTYIGTEHLLLALLRDEHGVGGKVLANLGVEMGTVRDAIETVLGRNERISTQRGLVPTSRVKKVFELAFEEARRSGKDHVGTEHLLLGLLIEGEGVAAHVLEDLGAPLSRVRAEIERLARDAHEG